MCDSELVETFDLVELNAGKNLDELRNALKEVGFIQVKNHGFDPTLLRQYFIESKSFFNNPKELKENYKYKSTNNSGWLEIGTETLNRNDKSKEFKEAINFNVDELPLEFPDGFNQSTVTRFIDECRKVCQQILRAYAASLQIDTVAGGIDFFTNCHQPHLPSASILRSLYYPAINLNNKTDLIRAGGHSDFGSITLLFTEPNDPGGLEIVKPGTVDTFVPVKSVESQIIVNTGDLLEYWTGSYFRSTIHRVVLPEVSKQNQSRYSIAFFLQAESKTPLSVIPSQILRESNVCLQSRESKAFEDFAASKINGVPATANEHLQLRLNHIHQNS
ncbi:hypothetical protein BC833DRAFT_571124 [Globomyces pollinis-pini]|nr:hypothetical protein BC833DRAFT_571124 [Globomyces pollinis-pini]